MNRKKLIKKLAIPAAIVAVVSVIMLFLQIPYRDAQYKNHLKKAQIYIDEFNKEQLAYLKGIGEKIKTIQVEPNIVAELEAEYSVVHQQTNRAKKYLWMSDANGEFLFGVRNEVFEKFNTQYDRLLAIIKPDGVFRTRDDFLQKLIDKHNQIDFSDFQKGKDAKKGWRENHWRFNRIRGDWTVFRSVVTTFKLPVYDIDKNIIGTIFMNVDDSINKNKYLNDNFIARDDLYSILIPIFVTLLVISCTFLWFLLPTWVYSDALERDVKNPGIWAFLSIVSLFFGLTIYLITRPAETKSFHCPKCEGELNGTRAFCPHCGNDLSSTFCQECQYPVKPNWSFCPNCRAPIKKSGQINNNTSEATATNETEKEDDNAVQ